MRVWRCFLQQSLASGDEVQLPEPLAHRLLNVLRVRVGDALQLFDGKGNEYLAQLTKLAKSGASARIGERVDVQAESVLSMTLGQGICRGEKMDLVIQKATELGVVRIVPLITERVEVQLDGQRLQRRLEHWQQVATSAAEQSQRSAVPEISAPMALLDFVFPGALLLDPAGTHRTRDLPMRSQLSLLVGPEGGFSRREVEAAIAREALALRLGPRTLRTETAGLAALAILQSQFGDM